MSGHSKWANIKNRKGAQDKKRSETFTRMAKQILTAIRENGSNTNAESNVSLKTAIDKAKAVNMPKENIERLVHNFEARKANLITFFLEGYGPGGVPIMIEVETDNKNRVLGEIKFILKDHDGSLGSEGSVAYQFDKRGEIELEMEPSEEKQLVLIDLGVVEIEENYLYVMPTELKQTTDRLREMGEVVMSTALVMKPKSPMVIKDEGQAGKVVDLIEELEDNEDVINVFAGFRYDA